MSRSRPELPSDSEPVGRDGEPDELRKRRRKRRDEERDAAEPTPAADDVETAPSDEARTAPESPDASDAETVPLDPERVRREVAAEAAFRERVALSELADRLTPESYAALEKALAGRTADWRLEKGRYLFAFLVGERTVPAAGRTARIEQRLPLHRDEPPVEPARVDELVATAASAEDASGFARRLESLRKELPDGDEIRIRTAPDAPEIVVTADAVTVEPEPGAGADGEAPSGEGTAAASPAERPEPLPETPEPTREEVDRLVAEVEREPEEESGRSAEARSDRVPEPGEPGHVAGTADERPPARPPQEETPFPAGPDLAGALELLEREAVDLNDLPPIRGGAPEPGEPGPPGIPPEPPESEEPPEERPDRPEQPVPEQPEPPTAEETVPGLAGPEPRPPRERRRVRRRGRRVREVLRWDPDSAEVVRYPDHAMRKKARKLVRRLAAEYGVKLTPQVEAYLLGIVLRPHLLNGRPVYSIGLNVETLVSVLHVLKYNFNLTRRPPA